MPTITRGLLAVFIASLGYSTLPILSKLALDEGVAVFTLQAWRFAFAGAVLWGVVAATRRRLPSTGRTAKLIPLGVLYAGISIIYMFGLDRLPASLASITLCTYPAATALLARIWDNEPITAHRLWSLLLVMTGFVATAGVGFGLSGDAFGFGLMLLCVLLTSVWTVLMNNAISGVRLIAGAATLVTSAAVVIMVGGIAVGGVSVPTPKTLLLIAVIGVFATAMPLTLFLLGVRWIGPARTAISSTLEPVATLALAAVVLGDRLSAYQWAGVLCIVAGVMWLRLERQSHPQATRV